MALRDKQVLTIRGEKGAIRIGYAASAQGEFSGGIHIIDFASWVLGLVSPESEKESEK
jgi:predicted dehydrogenase